MLEFKMSRNREGEDIFEYKKHCAFGSSVPDER